ncbi:hypothetical protein [Sinorhizobium sp. BG8]|uniref:hypothetical protein n=1 Tax=Sinorhizobium sp. BG8 TaxID=2613773 RepID=UPI00193CEA17|nr:hypothetical protein [Sinorhizobium sp. BG8]QRM55114.1 hypothetical protein F3Y30_11660 [Sinorhizobium sp. BG8]
MTRSALRQADAERLIKAAQKHGAVVQFDMKTLVATIIPAVHSPAPIDAGLLPDRILPSGIPARNGKEHWDED